MMPREVRSKSTAEITTEWDALAPIRYIQITSGADITYRHILVPRLLALVSREKSPSVIVDSGCGIGFLSNLLVNHAGRVTGIDPSMGNIEIANRHYGARAKFIKTTLEEYSSQNDGSATIVVANMVLMNLINLDSFLAAAYRILQPGGALIFSVTHPCFWARYYGYAAEPWFSYDRKIVIEGPFRITAQRDCALVSTHVHRPLAAYIEAFRRAHFWIDGLEEPMPSGEIADLYPESWVYPRYLIGACRR